jgi:hypothetical protein
VIYNILIIVQNFRYIRVPSGFWKDESNKKKFFKWIEKTLNINNIGDWKSVKKSDIESLGGKTLLMEYKVGIYGVYLWLKNSIGKYKEIID